MPGALVGCGSFRAVACCPSRAGGPRASAMGRDSGGGCAAAMAIGGAAACFAISANDCHKSALALAVSTSARSFRFSVSSGRCWGLLSGVETFLLAVFFFVGLLVFALVLFGPLVLVCLWAGLRAGCTALLRG